MTTFLEMTNRVLRRLNEVELTTDNFTNTRGLHSAAKDAVNDAIRHVDRHPGHWPWNAKEITVNLSIGVSEYDFPPNFRSAEWRTFQLQRSEEFNISPTTLDFIERDVWYENLRDRDSDTYDNDFGTPRFVFEGHGSKFGVSPAPDHSYDLKYRFYSFSPRLVNPTDVISVPEDWDDVVFYGALMFLHAFKENADQAAMFEAQFKEALNEMTNVLLNRGDYMRDTRLHFNRRIPGNMFYA